MAPTIKENIDELSILPTIRYYSKYNFFLTASYIYGKGVGILQYPISDSYHTITVNSSFTSEIIGANASIGYAIKAGKAFLIEPQLSFNYATINTDYTVKYEQVGYSQYFNLTNNFSKAKTEVIRKNYLLGIGMTYRF